MSKTRIVLIVAGVLLGLFFMASPAQAHDHHPKPCPSVTASPSPSVTPSESPSESPSETPSETPSESPSESVSPTPSDTPSESPTPSDKPTASPSDTPGPSVTPTPTKIAGPSTAPQPVPSLSELAHTGTSEDAAAGLFALGLGSLVLVAGGFTMYFLTREDKEE